MITSLVNNASEISGVPTDQILLLICLFLSILLSYSFRLINSYYVRVLISVIISIPLQILNYGNNTWYLFTTDLFCVFTILLLPRKWIGTVHCLYVGSVLSYIHFTRMYYDYGGWTMDVSLIYMMTTQRYTAYGLYYSSNEDKLKNFNLIEYISYIHFLPSCISGPFMEYSSYIDFIKLKNKYTNTNNLSNNVNKMYLKNIIPKKILIFMFVLAFTIITRNKLSPNHILLSLEKLKDEFSLINTNKNNFYYSFNLFIDFILFMINYFLIILIKSRYYIAFISTEIACDVSGISYDSSIDVLDKTTKNIEIVKCANVIKCETTIEVKEFFKNWNIATHKWLKEYCFKRLIPLLNSQIKAEIVTFIISALWHGFYPSYFIVFGSFIVGQFIQKDINYTKLALDKANSLICKYIKAVYLALYYFNFYIFYSYLFLILDSLEIEKLIHINQQFYYLPYMSCLFILILGKLGKFTVKNSKFEIKKN